MESDGRSFRLTPTRRRLLAVASPAVVILLGSLIAVGFGEVRKSRAEVGESRNVLLAASSALQRLTDAETGQRGYLLTGDERYLAPYEGARSDAFAAVARLEELTAGREDAGRLSDSLRTLVARRTAVLDERLRIRREQGFEAAREALITGGGLGLMTAAREIVAELEGTEQRLLAASIESEARRTTLLAVLMIVGTLFVTTASLLLNRVLVQSAEREEEAARELARHNTILQEQAAELEMQQQQLQEQAAELEMQAERLQDQQTELEVANEELVATAEELQARTVLAEELRDIAEAANRAKGDFLAMMSHELRTPLNAISGYTELLQLGLRGGISDEQAEDLRRIQANSRHLLGMINDVLNFARVESGKLEFRSEPVELLQFIGTLEPMISPQVQAAGLRYEVTGDAPVVVSADSEKLRQLLLNLIINAVKFTSAGGSVSVRVGVDQGNATVAITDTGCGIPADKLTDVFEPFVQVDRQLNSAAREGVGLGLAISRELAAAMDGELSVSSEVGRGSTFTVRLPVVAAGAARPFPLSRSATGESLTA
jgi:signal transduction histidine kinase